MKIAIATDSRGQNKTRRKRFRERCWVSYLADNLKNDHEFVIDLGYRSPKGKIATLFQIVEDLESRGDFWDLVICQCGHHGWDVSWSENVLRLMIPESRFDPSFLIPDGEFYFYHDEKLITEYIQRLKKVSKRQLFIGMHGWLFGGDRPQWSGYQHHQNILEMNDIFSRGVDYFHLPMHESWVNAYTKDRLHYIEEGHQFILGFVSRYIERLDKTIGYFANRKGKRRFVSVSNEKKPYVEFLNEAKKAGSWIASITKPRDTIVISKKTSFEQLYCFLGSILYNRVPIIIQHPSSKVSQTEFDGKMSKIQQAVQPALCLCDKDDAEQYKKFFVVRHDVEYPDPSPEPTLNPDAAAFIQLSSGTTGLPKVIEVSHRNAVAHCQEYAQFIGFGPKDCVASWLPLYHDMGMIACFIMPLVVGSSFAHISPFDWLMYPARFLRCIADTEATHVWMPNFAFRYQSQRSHSNKYSSSDLSSIKMVINCSEVTRLVDMEMMAKAFDRNGLKEGVMRVCYALAENVFAVSQTGAEMKSKNGTMSCGSIIPGTSVIIVKDGKDVTEKESGEIYIRSSYMPSLPSDFYGYYRTGDMGFMKNGELYVEGRVDDMIIRFGVNIYPYAIEKCLDDMDGIVAGRSACFGVYDNSIGTQNVYVCVEYRDSFSPEEIAEKARRKVFEETGITAVVIARPRDWIVKTSSGKVSRNRTKEKMLNELEVGGSNT